MGARTGTANLPIEPLTAPICPFSHCMGAALVTDGAHIGTIGATLDVMAISMTVSCMRCRACTASLPTCPLAGQRKFTHGVVR